MVMYVLKKNSHKAPFGGHQFHEYGTTIKAESYPELLEKVKNFRLTNSLPFGNPDQDILHYYVENWPWLVERADDVFVAPDAHYESWKAWVQKTWKKPPSKIVATAQAKTRWEVCQKCPFNRPINFPASPELDEAKKRTFLMKRGIDTPPTIGYCAVHRCDIGVLSFVDNAKDFSSKKPKGGSYEDCWV
jgi:hypothetical protein